MADAEAAEQGDGGGVMSAVFRGLVIYFAFMTIMKKPDPKAEPEKDSSGLELAGQPDEAAQLEPAGKPTYSNSFRAGQEVNLRVFLSETEDNFANADLVWSEDGIFYDWRDENIRTKNVSLSLTDRWGHLQHNGTIYAHVYFLLPSLQISPLDIRGTKHHRGVVQGVQQLNRYAALPKVKVASNLLGYGLGAGDSSKTDEGAAPVEAQTAELAVAPVAVTDASPGDVVSLWRPKLTFNLVVDQTVYARKQIPTQIADSMHFDRQTGKYEPKLFHNNFWDVRADQFPVNETLTTLDLEMEYYPISMWKWQLMEQMDSNWKTQREMGTGGGESETEVLKNMLTETSPALLVTTAVVSVLHMVFDCLAFKNDIKFWRNQKSMEGLSVGTVFINCFCSVVIFMYLCNSDEISRMILFSQGLGLCIEFWKIKRVVHVGLDYKRPMLGFIPRPMYKHRRSYQTVTAKYDAIAMRYMSYILYPAVIGYSIYSLRYESHKGWYAWVLGSLVGSVYTFGFIRMTPQLYINYKLKSVAHMPWKVMMYKSLNTFIDDLFAFIITMPMLHRLACFRDDLIFFIFLYQRYIYKVDETRLNEFGVSKDMYDSSDADAKKK